ncbi:MAG: LytTR family transcriptional regulator DNA-binding domain-containing protein [Paludibacter sp.]|nr:LytTR family transcriptional regulator DNA-binding domain-containing protein [Paludibacter sp.]
MLQKKLILDSETKIDLIEIEKITYITVDSFSSEIHLADGTKCHSSKTLRFFESSLPDTFFFRINRNTIANLSHIENINKLSRQIQIKGDILCISTRQLRSLANHLKQISVR